MNMRLFARFVNVFVLPWGANSVQMRLQDESLSHAEEKTLVDWKLCEAEVFSNLGGLGGKSVGIVGDRDKNSDGTLKQELRFKRVAEVYGGKVLDLVIVNTTEYTPNPENPKQAKDEGDRKIGGQWYNGKNLCFGRLNIKAPGEVVLKFSMVESGTDNPVSFDYSFEFSILDFDRSPQGMIEEATFYNFDSYYSGGMQLKNLEGGLTLVSKEDNVEIENPSDPMKLTPEQMAASLAVRYDKKNSWSIKFTASDSTNGKYDGGRNFMWAGKTLLCDKFKPKPPPPLDPCPDGQERDDQGICGVVPAATPAPTPTSAPTCPACSER